LKLAYVPRPSHRVWLSANADPASISNTSGGNSSLGVAESHQNQGEKPARQAGHGRGTSDQR
jgi:hypothetical protein